MDECYPCEETEESTQEVFLNFPVDQITWNNSESAVCDIFKVELNSETAEAKQSELNVWNQEKVHTCVPDTGKECISVRWVILPKLVDGTWKVKARLVARGFEENVDQIRSDSPTCLKESLRILLTLASTMDWKLVSLDIKCAFLQGYPIQRDLFVRPPKEAGATGYVWKLNKVVYGLSDASRAWYRQNRLTFVYICYHPFQIM